MQSLDDFLAEFVGDEDGNFMQNIKSQSKPPINHQKSRL
jgi:hypothetical protein